MLDLASYAFSYSSMSVHGADVRREQEGAEVGNMVSDWMWGL